MIATDQFPQKQPRLQELLESFAISGLSTSNASDMLLAMARGLGTALTSRPSGFTQTVASGTQSDSCFQVVGSTQSDITETYVFTTNVAKAMFSDAIMQAGGAPTQDIFLQGSP